MKYSWKGSLQFGLVAIDIELLSAVQPRVLSFKLFHATCNSPIEYHRWCNHCHKEVSWHDIEKGIRLRDGSYFMMTPARLKSLKHEKTESITLLSFVNPSIIDPILLHEHFYVVPANNHSYSFFLFAQALHDLDKIAICRFVLREKEHICIIRPYKNFLLLTTLNYAYEIKKLAETEFTKMPKINKQELILAEQLIKGMVKKSFNISEYKDTFVVNLLKKIKTLKSGKAIAPAKKSQKPESTTLLTTLKKSVTEIKGHTAKRRKNQEK